MPFREAIHHKHNTEPEALSETIFHPFNKLPAELRIKIWSLALPEPRNLLICSGLSGERLEYDCRETTNGKFKEDYLEFRILVYGNKEEEEAGLWSPCFRTAPESSPLRLACREASTIWSANYQQAKILESNRPYMRTNDYYLHRHPVPLMEGPLRPGESRGPKIELLCRGFIDYRRDTLILGESRSPDAIFIEQTKSFYFLDVSQCRSIAYRLSDSKTDREAPPFIRHFKRTCPHLEKITYILGSRNIGAQSTTILTDPDERVLRHLHPSYLYTSDSDSNGPIEDEIMDCDSMYQNCIAVRNSLEEKFKKHLVDMLESYPGRTTLRVAYMDS